MAKHRTRRFRRRSRRRTLGGAASDGGYSKEQIAWMEGWISGRTSTLSSQLSEGDLRDLAPEALEEHIANQKKSYTQSKRQKVNVEMTPEAKKVHLNAERYANNAMVKQSRFAATKKELYDQKVEELKRKTLK